MGQKINMNFPILTTKRLHLSEITKQDIHSVFRLFSDLEVVKHYDIEAFTSTNQANGLIDLFTKRFMDKAGIRWGIRLKHNDGLIGTCGFNSWNTRMRCGNLGYDLLPQYWGKGITSEAVNAAITAAFEGELACGALNRIQAEVIPENKASERMLLKMGFTEEGLHRQSGFWKGEFHDLKFFGLLKSDFFGENEDLKFINARV